MNIEQHNLREITRRQFYAGSGLGIGSIGLASLMSDSPLWAAKPKAADRGTNPLAPQQSHFPGKAKQVIYLFMAGGPSHLELFDYKPKLQELNGQVIPPSYVENKRFAFLKKDAKLLGTRRTFNKHGESGQEISELLPNLASIADQVAIVRTMTSTPSLSLSSGL